MGIVHSTVAAEKFAFAKIYNAAFKLYSTRIVLHHALHHKVVILNKSTNKVDKREKIIVKMTVRKMCFYLMLTTARVTTTNNDFVFGQGQNGRDIYSQWFSECIVYLVRKFVFCIQLENKFFY